MISRYDGVFIPNLSYDPPLATKPFCISTTIRPKLILDPARHTSNILLDTHNAINKHDLVFITMKCRYSRASTNYPVRSTQNPEKSISCGFDTPGSRNLSSLSQIRA